MWKQLANQLKFSFIALFLLSMLTACGQGGAGSDDENAPHTNAVAFFDALYNSKDLNQAVKYVTPKESRVMLSYKTASAVQRHLLNMKFDSVTIVVDKDQKGKALLTDKAKKAEVTLMFEGKYDGRTVRDMKTVKMVKQKNIWKVAKIKADPYS